MKFYKGFSKDPYKINKLMIKKLDDNNLLNTLKKSFIILKYENLKL